MGRKKKVQETCSVCGSDYFRCGNRFCRRKGCQTVNCTNQTFEKFEECKHCGHVGFLPVFKAASRTPSGAGKKPPTDWNKIFVGGAIAVVALALGYPLLSNIVLNDTPGQRLAENDLLPVINPETRIAVANISEGVCQCYKEGFKLAGRNANVLSSEYGAGFVLCRELYGVDGGDAWTAGWNARLSQEPYEVSCKSYRKRQG